MGVSNVQRPSNNSTNPASGPECSVPAIGCAGTKCTPAGTSGPTSRITDCLVDPTSVSTAPGARCGAMRAARSANAPTGAHSITQSAPSTALAGSISTRSAMPSSLARWSVFWVRALTTISAAISPRCRAMRATEDPINPIPIRARRLKTGSVTGLPLEISERLDNQVNLLDRAGVAAQTLRQAVSADLPHYDAAGLQEGISGVGSLRCLEISQDEVFLARPNLDAGGLQP